MPRSIVRSVARFTAPSEPSEVSILNFTAGCFATKASTSAWTCGSAASPPPIAYVPLSASRAGVGAPHAATIAASTTHWDVRNTPARIVAAPRQESFRPVARDAQRLVAPLTESSLMRDWQAPAGWRRVTTIDAHAAGEPLRVVTSGIDPVPGATILEKRRYAREHLDGLRRALMFEPRGHADMYGAIMTDPVAPEGDLGVLFLHSEGGRTMCGHGIIALTMVVLETGLLSPRDVVRFDAPAGRIVARAARAGSRAQRRVRERPVVRARARRAHRRARGRPRALRPRVRRRLLRLRRRGGSRAGARRHALPRAHRRGLAHQARGHGGTRGAPPVRAGALVSVRDDLHRTAPRRRRALAQRVRLRGGRGRSLADGHRRERAARDRARARPPRRGRGVRHREHHRHAVRRPRGADGTVRSARRGRARGRGQRLDHRTERAPLRSGRSARRRLHPPLSGLGAIARDPALRRVAFAFATFHVAEWATWIAMLVYAYERGGAAGSGR